MRQGYGRDAIHGINLAICRDVLTGESECGVVEGEVIVLKYLVEILVCFHTIYREVLQDLIQVVILKVIEIDVRVHVSILRIIQKILLKVLVAAYSLVYLLYEAILLALEVLDVVKGEVGRLS